MKKILLSLSLMLTALFFLPLAMADTTKSKTYNVKIEPISNALKAQALSASIHGTDIVVINYSATPIYVFYNQNSFIVDSGTSGRITSEAVQYPYMRLTDVYGYQIFPFSGYSKSVSNYATLSVYLINGQYVTYETPNP